MFLGFIIHVYKWHSSQLVELQFHASTDKSIERFEIISLWPTRQQIYFKVEISILEHNVEESEFCGKAINEQKTDLICLILLAQVSNQMVFDIVTAVAFYFTGVSCGGWDRDMYLLKTYLKDEEEGLGKGLQIVGKGGNKVGNSGEKE